MLNLSQKFREIPLCLTTLSVNIIRKRLYIQDTVMSMNMNKRIKLEKTKKSLGELRKFYEIFAPLKFFPKIFAPP